MHAQSVEDPASFWGEIAEKFHWKMSPTKDNFLSYNFNVNNGPIEVSELIFLIPEIHYQRYKDAWLYGNLSTSPILVIYITDQVDVRWKIEYLLQRS